MKLAVFPLELAKPLVRKAYTRDAYASLLCRGISFIAGFALAGPMSFSAQALELSLRVCVAGVGGLLKPLAGLPVILVNAVAVLVQ